jgi:hypothetical protein
LLIDRTVGFPYSDHRSKSTNDASKKETERWVSAKRAS